MQRLLPLLCALAFSLGLGLDRLCETRSRKIFLYLGEMGTITANRTIQTPGPGVNSTRREYCVVELETCPSCLISIKFRHLDLRDNCERRPVDGVATTAAATTACRCDYIWISESSYEEISGTPLCGYWTSEFGKESEPGYRSETRSVVITFLFKYGRDHEFSMTYTSERNRKFFFGPPQSLLTGPTAGGNIFTSPFFPVYYPRDLVSEYVISCIKYPYATRRTPKKTEVNACRIRLIFTDFHLSPSSVMEFFDGSRRRIGLANGSTFRPPVIVTNSSRLMIRFTANGGRSLGFKAEFSFIQGNYNNPLVEPNMDCGGLVEDLGGAITMMNMVGAGTKTFDCVWLIRPPESFFVLTGYLVVRVYKYENFAGYAELEIRDGLISNGPLLERIHYSSLYMGKEHITSLRSGFYINLKASFGPSSALGITFSSFHYNKCFTGPDFLCLNHRCIPGKLVCDGFDHCGDNSDESDLCIKDWHGKPGYTDRKWGILTPNYYFPKVEHYSELKTATLVFIASSMGLIVFLAILIILLYRMGSRSRNQNDFQSRLQTITEFLDDAEIEEIIDDEPPLYEAPPDYEAAMKETASKQQQRSTVDVVRVKAQVSGVSSRRMVVIMPESVPMASRHSRTESERREEGVIQLPASPPPPYVNDEGNDVFVVVPNYSPIDMSTVSDCGEAVADNGRNTSGTVSSTTEDTTKTPTSTDGDNTPSTSSSTISTATDDLIPSADPPEEN